MFILQCSSGRGQIDGSNECIRYDGGLTFKDDVSDKIDALVGTKMNGLTVRRSVMIEGEEFQLWNLLFNPMERAPHVPHISVERRGCSSSLFHSTIDRESLMKLVVSRWSDNELSTAALTIYTITGANERYTSLLSKIRCTSIVIFFFRSVKISIY